MFSSGLMLLNLPVSQVLTRIGSYICAAKKSITGTLYIAIEPNLVLYHNHNHNHNQHDSTKLTFRKELVHVVPQIYIEASKAAPALDVRVIHNSMKNTPRNLQFPPQIIFVNQSNVEEQILKSYLNSNFNLNNIHLIETIRSDIQFKEESNTINEKMEDIQIYDNVCLGGTFDNLHYGHKVLLSTAQLLCKKSLTIGVTDLNMIKSKVLWELIEPVEKRIENLLEYLKDVDPLIDYKITAISDPYGPAISDEHLECIVVSEETVRGGEKINEIRRQRKMTPLHVKIISLVKDKDNATDENKISSSSLRMKKLEMLKEKEKE